MKDHGAGQIALAERDMREHRRNHFLYGSFSAGDSRGGLMRLPAFPAQVGNSAPGWLGDSANSSEHPEVAALW